MQGAATVNIRNHEKTRSVLLALLNALRSAGIPEDHWPFKTESLSEVKRSSFFSLVSYIPMQRAWINPFNDHTPNEDLANFGALGSAAAFSMGGEGEEENPGAVVAAGGQPDSGGDFAFLTVGELFNRLKKIFHDFVKRAAPDDSVQAMAQINSHRHLAISIVYSGLRYAFFGGLPVGLRGNMVRALKDFITNILSFQFRVPSGSFGSEKQIDLVSPSNFGSKREEYFKNRTDYAIWYTSQWDNIYTALDAMHTAIVNVGKAQPVLNAMLKIRHNMENMQEESLRFWVDSLHLGVDLPQSLNSLLMCLRRAFQNSDNPEHALAYIFGHAGELGMRELRYMFMTSEGDEAINRMRSDQLTNPESFRAAKAEEGDNDSKYDFTREKRYLEKLRVIFLVPESFARSKLGYGAGPECSYRELDQDSQRQIATARGKSHSICAKPSREVRHVIAECIHAAWRRSLSSEELTTITDLIAHGLMQSAQLKVLNQEVVDQLHLLGTMTGEVGLMTLVPSAVQSNALLLQDLLADVQRTVTDTESFFKNMLSNHHCAIGGAEADKLLRCAAHRRFQKSKLIDSVEQVETAAAEMHNALTSSHWAKISAKISQCLSNIAQAQEHIHGESAADIRDRADNFNRESQLASSYAHTIQAYRYLADEIDNKALRMHRVRPETREELIKEIHTAWQETVFIDIHNEAERLVKEKHSEPLAEELVEQQERGRLDEDQWRELVRINLVQEQVLHIILERLLLILRQTDDFTPEALQILESTISKGVAKALSESQKSMGRKSLFLAAPDKDDEDPESSREAQGEGVSAHGQRMLQKQRAALNSFDEQHRQAGHNPEVMVFIPEKGGTPVRRSFPLSKALLMRKSNPGIEIEAGNGARHADRGALLPDMRTAPDPLPPYSDALRKVNWKDRVNKHDEGRSDTSGRRAAMPVVEARRAPNAVGAGDPETPASDSAMPFAEHGGRLRGRQGAECNAGAGGYESDASLDSFS